MGCDGVAINLVNNYLNKQINKSMEENSLWKSNSFSTDFE